MGEKVEKCLNSLIIEYLTAKGYLNTVSTLKTESAAVAKQSQPLGLGGVHPEFLEAFECGERHAFFELWREHIPSSLLNKSPSCLHLECTISAYFAVYPARTGVGHKDQAMSDFRSYLDKRGSLISQNQQLATYFALPYIPDPSQHPHFSNLYLKSWTEELRGRLVQFLEKAISRPSSCPTLISMYLNSKKISGAVLQEDCIQKIGEVQTAYHTLCGIAMELVGALESTVAGEQIAPEFISGICSRLFENSVPPSSINQPSRPSTALRESILSLYQSVDASDHAPQKSPPLDFGKIKSSLRNGTPLDQSLLLQALRWRLTRSLPGSTRDAVLSSYISNDILGCSQAQDVGHTPLILPLMRSPDQAIREQIARLFNTFSSLAHGRKYLSEAPPITRALLDMLYDESGESATRRNSLGALQKLSLRRSVSRLMIKHSIVKWIVENALGNANVISDYTLRYSLALLMNISLRAGGRSSCASYGAALLETLGSMLGHPEEEISEYINGTLYSLFVSPRLQQQARQMGMGNMLEKVLQKSSAQRKTQLQYILHQLNQEPTGQEAEGEGLEDSEDEGQEDDEDDEPDPDVIEGDEGEVIPATDRTRGDALLTQEYTWRPQTRSLSVRKDKEPLATRGAQEEPPRGKIEPLAPRGAQEPLATRGAQEEPPRGKVEPLATRGAQEEPPRGKVEPITTRGVQEVGVSLPRQDAMPPSIRPVTPQSFRPHSSANIRSSTTQVFQNRKIVSASPYK